MRILSALLLVALPWPSPAIILIGAQEADNLLPPPDGSPWGHAARLQNQFGSRASGVYLGNRYVLTAEHIDADIDVVVLNGQDYAKDNAFLPVQIGGVDLRLMRIATDPGLPALPLLSTTESELNQPCTVIGHGAGKGAVVPNQGWQWADDARPKRWGTNFTLGTYFTDPNNQTVYVRTTFDFAAGPEEAQLTIGDSGCGMFQMHGGVWKLAAIGVDAETGGQALYDHTLATLGNQPDYASFVPLRNYAGELRQIRTGYAAWAGAFGANPGGTSANPDGDTFDNLLEFAFGLDPQSASPASLSTSPTVVRGGAAAVPGANAGEWHARYVRRDDFLSVGLTYVVQFSTDLSTWEPSTATPVVVADSGAYEIVSVPFPTGAAGARFFRVLVTME